MKFRFPLQKVMEHRKVLEDIAQRDFQLASAELNKQIDLLNKMIQQVYEARARAGEIQFHGGFQAGDSLKQIHDFIKGQDIRIERQRAKVKESEKLVEERRDFLRQKAVDYKIIERLRDHKFDEHKRNMHIADQKEIDEMNVLRFENEEKE